MALCCCGHHHGARKSSGLGFSDPGCCSRPRAHPHVVLLPGCGEHGRQTNLTIPIPAAGLRAGAGQVSLTTAKLWHTGSTLMPKRRYVQTQLGLTSLSMTRAKGLSLDTELSAWCVFMMTLGCVGQHQKQKSSLNHVHIPQVNSTCWRLCLLRIVLGSG